MADLRRQQDAAVYGVAGRTQPEPHPGGLTGHAARAHDQAETAFAAGDIDGAIAGDMLSAALSAAALADR